MVLNNVINIQFSV